MQMQKQQGVGLIEVLVALFILIIAVLGFVGLQVRAIEASQDAIFKTQAIQLMQSLSESMRVNNTAKASYVTDINSYLSSISKPTASINCNKNLCTPAQLSVFESYAIARQASIQGVQLGVATCPGIAKSTVSLEKRLCIFAVWKNTELSVSAGALNYSNCMPSSGDSAGIYVSSSNCLMMESY